MDMHGQSVEIHEYPQSFQVFHGHCSQCPSQAQVKPACPTPYFHAWKRMDIHGHPWKHMGGDSHAMHGCSRAAAACMSNRIYFCSFRSDWFKELVMQFDFHHKRIRPRILLLVRGGGEKIPLSPIVQSLLESNPPGTPGACSCTFLFETNGKCSKCFLGQVFQTPCLNPIVNR